MGRAPCCEKVGLKKGPWTQEEDLILINYINTHGHNNWRTLPKLAGLLRCGKSCRLRWINYLRPDIKRGKFTEEEEDTIIKLHEKLGNRWSAIAARLPGRTDNEIKNVWHTHLKKRLQQPQCNNNNKSQDTTIPIPKQNLHLALDSKKSNQYPKQEHQQEPPVNPRSTHQHHHVMIKVESTEERSLSPPQCSSSDMSTLTSIITTTNQDLSTNNFSVQSINDGDNLALDEDFWSEVLSSDNSNGETRNFQDILGGELKFQFAFSSLAHDGEGLHISSSSSLCDHGMDFWYDMFSQKLSCEVVGQLDMATHTNL